MTKPENMDKAVKVIYINHRHEANVRTITPGNLYFGSSEWHPEPQWLLECWDHGKEAVRTFAQCQISSWISYKDSRRRQVAQIQGRVSGVKITPGSGDVILFLDKGGYQTEELLPRTANLKLDGEPILLATLLVRFLIDPKIDGAIVTLYATDDTYEAITDAAFETRD